MYTDTDTDDRQSASEPVDLDDARAVQRAIALHQAGKAVFAVPFNTTGAGTLTWLDPRERERQAGTAAGSLK